MEIKRNYWAKTYFAKLFICVGRLLFVQLLIISPKDLSVEFQTLGYKTNENDFSR